jgi:antitoxin PrlF
MATVLDMSQPPSRIFSVKIPTKDVTVHSIISEKGQITVPKRLRERLGIRPGDRLQFSEQHGRLVVSKTTDQDPVQAVYGILSLGESTDDALRALRGEAEGGLITAVDTAHPARRG